MSDTPPVAPGSAVPQTPASLGDVRLMALICYALFIATFTNGLTGVVGVVLAYIKRADARGTIWESHFTNLIHVFWIGFAFFALFIAAIVFGVVDVIRSSQTNQLPGAVFLVPVVWLGSLAYVIWYLYRTVKGLLRAIDHKAYD